MIAYERRHDTITLALKFSRDEKQSKENNYRRVNYL